MDKDQFWKNFLRSLGTDPRDERVLVGRSGVKHSILGLGVNDRDRRIVVISDDPDARTAALLHLDISVTMPDTQIVVARPVAVDLSRFAKIIEDLVGNTILSREYILKKLDEVKKEDGGLPDDLLEKIFGFLLYNIKNTIENVPLTTLSQIQQVMVQLTTLNWKSIFDNESKQLDIGVLSRLDVTGLDKKLGVCPIPLFEFSADSFEAMCSGQNLDDIREILSSQGIYQYFFPSPDQVMLGLTENISLTPSALLENTRSCPSIGHPFEKNEIANPTSSMLEILDELNDRGYIANVEYGIQLTDKGREVRAQVTARPREGLIFKLINNIRLSINVENKF